MDWSNGFYGVPLEALEPSASPLSMSADADKLTKSREHVLHSIYSPTHLNQLYSKRVGRTKHQRLPVAPETPTSKKQDVSSTSDVFWSPAQFSIAASHSMASPFSPITHHTHGEDWASSSFRSLPSIEMLSADFIQSCTNLDELRQIASVLRTEGNCPSLLKLAQDRFSCISETKQYDSFAEASTKETPKRVESRDTPPTTGHSSLAYSLDHQAYPPPPPPVPNLSVPLPKQAAKSVTFSRNLDREQELAEEVKRLTMTIVELEEVQQKEQKDYASRIQALDDTKENVREKLRSMEGRLSSSQKTTKDLLGQLANLREQLQNERIRHGHTQSQSKALEEELTAKVNRLTNDLERLQNEAAMATAQRKENCELCQLLQTARKDLDDITMERTVMLRAMMTASGDEVPDIDAMPRRERRRIIADLAKQSAVSKCALDTLAGAVKRSELGARHEVERRKKAEALLQDSDRDKHQLEKENKELSMQVQKVLKDLDESRAHVEKLLQSTTRREDDDWTHRECTLNNVIKGLKQQLRDEASMARLYRAESQKRKQLGREVVMLKKKLALAVEPNKCLPQNGDAPAVTPAADESGSSGKENAFPPQNSKGAFECPPKSGEKSQLRIDQRRAAGGRRALEDKLKKIRSPHSVSKPSQLN